MERAAVATFTAIILAAVAAIPTIADARQPRSAIERHAFVKANPCPVTGRARLPCPGYEIDHVAPLCAGGTDLRGNMQWLSVTDHKAKTRQDVAACRITRTAPSP